MNLQKIPTCSIFSNDLRAVLLRYQIPHKIDIFPGKITFSINGSVNSKRAHSSTPPPPDICLVFVILFWKICKYPTMGLKMGYKCPTPGQHQNCISSLFSISKLQIPYLWEICNNLIKRHEAPYANHPQLPVIIVAKITSI